MKPTIWTAQAQDDLLDIWSTIALDNGPAADRFSDRVYDACALIASQPGIGPARDELGPGLRIHPVGKYLVVYRESESHIDIVRVVHGARFLPDML